MLKVLSYILCDLDPSVKVIGQKAGICDGVPSTSALVFVALHLKSTAMVMVGKSVNLATLFSWASLNKWLTSTSCT